MSLFTHDEVCDGCLSANWIDSNLFWDNKRRFAKCSKKAETDVDAVSGTCPSRVTVGDLMNQVSKEKDT